MSRDGRAAGEGPEGHEAEFLAVVPELELDVALGAVRVGGFDIAAAAVAEAEEVGDAGDAFGRGPELMGRRASEDRVEGDASTRDEGDDGFVGAAGLVGTVGVSDEPGAHRVLRSLAREGVEKSAAVRASRLVGGCPAAVGADEHRRRDGLAMGGVSGGVGGGFGGGLHRLWESIRTRGDGGCVRVESGNRRG